MSEDTKDKSYHAVRLFGEEAVSIATNQSIKPTSKLVHFVRHAQGLHNAAADIDHDNYLKEEYEDCALTPLGIDQCKTLNSTLLANGVAKTAQALLLSPMRRTIQTASYCFPNHMNNIPFVALESLRERSGLHPCDRRRPVHELQTYYAHVDFSMMQDDIDPLYRPERETPDIVFARCRKFMIDLASRPETELIVVGHSGYFDHLFETVVLAENDKTVVRFNNCELRSFVIDFD